MAKPRKQTYTMEMYLAKIKDLDIRSDADVQRMAGQWNKEMMNELIFTVLTEDYIPPIILGEEASSQLWIIDGLQRSSSLRLYRYGNYIISSAIEDSVIPYKEKSKDENGNIVWKDAAFDIRGKSYEQLPDELKKRFNEYQIETVIHEKCDMRMISKKIKIYNNHVGMNVAQKSLTRIGNFARDIRRIVETDFFSTLGIYKDNDIIKGNLERIVSESVMCMFHLEHWKKQINLLCDYLNRNARKEEFQRLSDNVKRLADVVTDDVKDIFTVKDSFIFLSLFDRFTLLGLEDKRFVDFLQAFKNEWKEHPVDNKRFYEIDKEKGTKDKSVIVTKLHILESLMLEFLHIAQEDAEEVDYVSFVKENVGSDVTTEDIELFEMVANEKSGGIESLDSWVLSDHNRAPFVALVGYAMREDQDDVLDEWLPLYEKTGALLLNQKESFLHMRADFERFVANKDTC